MRFVEYNERKGTRRGVGRGVIRSKYLNEVDLI